MKKTAFTIPVRVYIEDTDAGGIVFYVNYLKYFERARTEYFRQLGYDKPAFVEQDKMFVVHSLQIKYMKPARLDDSLQVSASIAKRKRASLVFEQLIYRDQELLVASEVVIACVDKKSLQTRAIPADILQAIDYNMRH